MPGAADPGLHLVEHQQRTVPAVISRASTRYPAGGTTTPPSPMIGSRNTAAVSSVTAAASAPTSPNGTCVTSAGQRPERRLLAGWPVRASEPMVRP